MSNVIKLKLPSKTKQLFYTTSGFLIMKCGKSNIPVLPTYQERLFLTVSTLSHNSYSSSAAALVQTGFAQAVSEAQQEEAL